MAASFPNFVRAQQVVLFVKVRQNAKIDIFQKTFSNFDTDTEIQQESKESKRQQGYRKNRRWFISERDLQSLQKPNDVHFHYSQNLISHTQKTSPPVRRRRIYGVSRQTRTHLSIIDHQYIFWIFRCYSLPSHFCSHTIGSFGFQHTDVVFNITHTVADGISNGSIKRTFSERLYISFLPSKYIHISDPCVY